MKTVTLKNNSIFISDVHIGSIGCESKKLFEFLKSQKEISQLFLVGDIIDMWKLKKRPKLNESEMKLIKKIISLSNKGTDVYYIAGNHDEFLREFIEDDDNMRFGNIEFYDSMCVQTKNHKKYLVIHGDQFDSIIKYHKWVAKLGDIMYEILLWGNTYIKKFQSFFGLPNWSLSKFVKQNVKQALAYIQQFETIASKYSLDNEFDGVICGHIHRHNNNTISVEDETCHYLNCGDWVEVCSYIKYKDNTFHVFENKQ